MHKPWRDRGAVPIGSWGGRAAWSWKTASGASGQNAGPVEGAGGAGGPEGGFAAIARQNQCGDALRSVEWVPRAGTLVIQGGMSATYA